MRSKSAPPSPRDGDKAPSIASRSRKGTLPSTPAEPSDDDENGNGNEGTPSTVVQTLEAIVTADELKDVDDNSKIKELTTTSHSTSEATPTAAAVAVATPPRDAPLKKRALSSAALTSAFPGSISSPTSRPTSPVPSLEAILLDRKRRLVAAAAAGKDTSSVTAPPVPVPIAIPVPSAPAIRVTTPSSKGASKFKSSPLGGGERTGVVVAEVVKQEMRDKEEGVRIPGEMDKAGPDKKEDDSGYL